MSHADRDDRSPSQTTKALLAVRDEILRGELASGARISELSVVERTGVSRTPVRMALVRLEEEGLLESIPSGGFAVRSFTEADLFDAIEIRGALEGLAARLAAERGVSAQRLVEIKHCAADMDEVVRRPDLNGEAFEAYVGLNERFHALLIDLAGSELLRRQMERALHLPFASPSGFVMAQSILPEARVILTVAQEQHRAVIDAIQNREGARADALMREHARVAHRNLQLALRHQPSLALVRGSALIRRRAGA